MSVVVVGTDTDVGKTVVSAVLLAHFRTCYWKPIGTGYPAMNDAATVGHLTHHQYSVMETLYGFPLAASPHLAAKHVRTTIDTKTLVHRLRALPQGTVVEGIGGVLVPLNDDGVFFADVVAQAELSVIVVTRGTLGTINHTLLTLEALRHRGIPIQGVIINGEVTLDNARDIAHFGGVPLLGIIPMLDALTPDAIVRCSAECLHVE